jgi:hypothetical protein
MSPNDGNIRTSEAENDGSSEAKKLRTPKDENNETQNFRRYGPLNLRS